MDHSAENWREFFPTQKTLQIVLQYPHLLGHLIGKEKLTPLHSQWIKYIWDSNEQRALQAFRGGFKTTAIGVVGAIRWMLFHPNDRIAIIRKSFKDAAEVVSAVNEAINFPQIRELFKAAHGHYPKARLQREGRIRYNFKTTTTPEVSLQAHGLDGSLTGKHYDKILCDDFVTLKDRISRAERIKTGELVREIATNIIDPGKGVGWIGTPWHREDAWQTVNSFCDIVAYPISRYNFLSAKEVEEKKRTTSPFLYAANYELILNNDESALFSEPNWAKGWDYNKRNTMAHLDAAFDGDHYNALTIMTPLKGDAGKPGTTYQAIGFTYPGNIKAWVPEVARLCRRYKVAYVYNETNPDKGATADKLRIAGLRVKDYPESQNKHMKISTHAYDLWPQIWWSPDTDPEYMNQCLDYREGMEPDDAPDSLASLVRQAFKTIKQSAWALYQ